MTPDEREIRWPKDRCEHCGMSYGYHEAGCQALIDNIVDDVTSGFRADIERIMADYPDVKPGNLTTEQQCALVAEASGWRARALKAEAAVATLGSQAVEPERDAVERAAIAMCNAAWADVGEDWSLASDEQKEEFRLMARAALASAPKASDGESGRG